LGDKDQSLFGVFDGHGGREVAVYCNRHFEKIMTDKIDLKNQTGGEREWMRQTFLNVDVELKTD